MRIDLRLMAVPSDADGESAELRSARELNDRSNAARYGPGIYVYTPPEFLALLQSTADERIERVHAWNGGRLAGALTLYWTMRESTDVVDIDVQLDPLLTPQQRIELGERLVATAVARAAALGRSTIVASTPGARAGAVTARTGRGAADARDPTVRPLIARGFALEQVYRVSVAALSTLTDLPERHASALRRAPAYELLRWSGETPRQHREGMRMLHERMSTDAPIAALAWDPEVWDEQRLTSFEQSRQAGGRMLLTVAARERSSGVLAGFSTLILPATGDVARQHDTLVTRAHRGHGLGMLMKLDTMVRLGAVRPEIGRIVTWNAEENRPMLAVNEACGFEPIAYEAQWQWRRP